MGAEVLAGGDELALALGALGCRQPAPGRIDFQEGVFHEVALGHASQRIVAALLALAAACALVPAAAGASAPAPDRTVLLAFLPFDTRTTANELKQPTILQRLDFHPELSLGLVGATQGGYDPTQALLDMSAGTRVSAAAYKPKQVPMLTFYPQGDGALFQGWLDARARAATAPAGIVPGLLGQTIPGGGAYAGVSGREQLESLPGVNEAGRIGLISIGKADDIASRTQRLLAQRRFVVAGLPTGGAGDAALERLIKDRQPNELLMVMETPPPLHSPQLLALGVLGLGGPSGLTSASTNLDGVVAGIDIGPTALHWLGLKVPDDMKGQPIELSGPRDSGALQALSDRLRVVSGRRFPALDTVLAAWLALALILGLVADRRGTRAAMRLGSLAIMWLLSVLLVTAALHPGRGLELILIAGLSFLLAALTDRFVPWPRGPLVPCLVTVVFYVVDLARGSDLIIRSLLGPNPRFGSRYYGIGNELEASLPVLLLIGLAALLYGRTRSRSGALIFAGAGLVLGAAIGSGRLGADVGGVITVGGGTAVAVLFMLPGGVTKRAIALACLVPIVALAALAGLELATGGNGAFPRNVLHPHGPNGLSDIVVRRYKLAFNGLKRGLMPFATAIALLTLAYGIKYRDRIFAPLRGSDVWRAALAGSIAAGVVGSLSNDSGPLLLVISTFAVVATTVYVRGDPGLARDKPVE